MLIIFKNSALIITGKSLYPQDLACAMCSRSDIRQFATEAKEIGIEYIGLCCGNAPNYFREIAEVYGRTPSACKYSPDVSQSFIFGEKMRRNYSSSEKLRQYMVFGKDKES